MIYESSVPRNSFGSHMKLHALGAPPGVTMSVQFAEQLQDLALALGLRAGGVVTPWAGRSGDLDWTEIENPDTNIALFELKDSDLQQAKQVLFGADIPFVTVITGELQSTTKLQELLNGSQYELFETQAVYRQDDSDPVPHILYLHWLRILPEETRPTRNVKPMESVAAGMHGKLTFSQQVPVEGSTLRSAPPTISFEEAFRSQEPAPIVVAPVVPSPSNPAPPTQPIQPPAAPSPSPTAPKASGKPGVLGLVLMGVGAAAATVAVGMAVRK